MPNTNGVKDTITLEDTKVVLTADRVGTTTDESSNDTEGYNVPGVLVDVPVANFSKIIVVFSPVRGSGCSSVAFLLAAGLSKYHGAEVCLLGTDEGVLHLAGMAPGVPHGVIGDVNNANLFVGLVSNERREAIDAIDMLALRFACVVVDMAGGLDSGELATELALHREAYVVMPTLASEISVAEAEAWVKEVLAKVTGSGRVDLFKKVGVVLSICSDVEWAVGRVLESRVIGKISYSDSWTELSEQGGVSYDAIENEPQLLNEISELLKFIE